MIALKKFFIPLLVLLHIVGIAIFITLNEAPEYSYLILVVSALLVLLSEEKIQEALLVFGIIYLGGFIIELIGVQTSFLFGSYEYTGIMGPKLLLTPVFIGATWYAVVKAAVSVASLRIKNKWLLALSAALLCTTVDLLIEIVAMKFQFWIWENNQIPFFNYCCWFLFSFLFALLVVQFGHRQNKTAIALFFIWVTFFSALIVL